MNSLEINDWLSVTKQYRSKLDLATIISYWMKLENMKKDDWQDVLKKIEDVAGDLIDKTHLNFDDFNIKNYWMYLTEKDFFETHGCKPPLSFFDFDNPPSLSDYEQWWCEYREKISKVTAFTDEMNFSEEELCAPPDEYYVPEEYFDQVLNNRELTRRFIDLDLLLNRYDEKGLIYHDYLRMPVGFQSFDDISYAGSTKLEKTSEEDPFYHYKLIGLMGKRLWGEFDEITNPNKAWKHLIDEVTPMSDPPFTSILAALHGTTSTMANHLRLFTQPSEMRKMNRSGSGKDLRPMLKPLMRFILVSDKYSIAFWSLKAEKRRLLIKDVLKITPGESKALLGLAVPNAYIRQDVNKDGGFSNPGSTSPKIIIRRAEQLVNDYLPELLNSKLQPSERDYYSDLKAAILVDEK